MESSCGVNFEKSQKSDFSTKIFQNLNFTTIFLAPMNFPGHSAKQERWRITRSREETWEEQKLMTDF
jgi:hypothetical protein